MNPDSFYGKSNTGVKVVGCLRTSWRVFFVKSLNFSTLANFTSHLLYLNIAPEPTSRDGAGCGSLIQRSGTIFSLRSYETSVRTAHRLKTRGRSYSLLLYRVETQMVEREGRLQRTKVDALSTVLALFTMAGADYAARRFLATL